MYRNRYTTDGNPRTERLPPVAVTPEERALVAKAADRRGVKISDVIREALVDAGILPKSSLEL